MQMTGPQTAQGAAADDAIGVNSTGPQEYPVREYIAAMSRELAQMARWDGDEGLGVLLDAVETRANAQAENPGLGWQR